MLNIVVPMAGRGSRFVEAGYNVPKPLIDIYGHKMIEYVIKNITPITDHRFIFICQGEHLEKYNLKALLEIAAPGCKVIPINHITEGAACTVLLAESLIDSKDPLQIANSDQFVDTNINKYLESMRYDGLIMTMPANHPKWSYIKCDENNMVTEVREKEVISNEATVGIYNFRQGSDYCKYARQMIRKNIRVNNEFYVAPVYNEMIADGMMIEYYNIGDKMHGMGTPEDLREFVFTDVCKRYFIWG